MRMKCVLIPEMMNDRMNTRSDFICGYGFFTDSIILIPSLSLIHPAITINIIDNIMFLFYQICFRKKVFQAFKEEMDLNVAEEQHVL